MRSKIPVLAQMPSLSVSPLLDQIRSDNACALQAIKWDPKKTPTWGEGPLNTETSESSLESSVLQRTEGNFLVEQQSEKRAKRRQGPGLG